MITNRGFVFRETGEVSFGVRVVLHWVGVGGSSMLARKLELNPILVTILGVAFVYIYFFAHSPTRTSLLTAVSKNISARVRGKSNFGPELVTSKYAIYTSKRDENHPYHFPMRVPSPIHPIQGDSYLATSCHFISSLAKVFFFDDMSHCLPYYDNCAAR